MKVLGFDIESLGVKENSLMIELACVPIDLMERKIEEKLAFSTLIKCPSFEELEPELSDWVRKHNEGTIREAHDKGVLLELVKKQLSEYLKSPELQEYFEGKLPVIFGKSLSGIDLPYMRRDFGWDWYRDHFRHFTKDLTDTALDCIMLGLLPTNCQSSSALAKLIGGKKDVDHRAYADIVDCAENYWKLLDLLSGKVSLEDIRTDK